MDPVTWASRYSHLRLETLCAFYAILLCCSATSPDCIPHVVVHRSWSLAIRTEFRTPVSDQTRVGRPILMRCHHHHVSHDIVLSVAVSAWLQNVPELSLLTPFVSSFASLRRGQAASTVRIPIDALRKSSWHRSYQRAQNAQVHLCPPRCRHFHPFCANTLCHCLLPSPSPESTL